LKLPAIGWARMTDIFMPVFLDAAPCGYRKSWIVPIHSRGYYK